VLAGGAAAAAAVYGAYAGLTWLRYGHVSVPRTPEEEDGVLDRFMPLYDIVERHHVDVRAPAELALSTACSLDLLTTPLASAIFKAREVVMGSKPSTAELPRGLVNAAQALGWRVLAEVPDRELVFGAATRPWEANPEFRSIAPQDFASFAEPGYVKIAWTLRADPSREAGCVFRTETRAVATDNLSRERFRRYWALVSPGVILVRLGMLMPVKRVAEWKAGAA
jgi:hypothetical protein